MTTNIQRADALMHLVLRISAIRTDQEVPADLMLSDLAIEGVSAIRHRDSEKRITWIVSLIANPDDGEDYVMFKPGGMGPTYRSAMDDALADYADKLMTAACIRMDWAEEEGEVA